MYCNKNIYIDRAYNVTLSFLKSDLDRDIMRGVTRHCDSHDGYKIITLIGYIKNS